MIATFGLTLFFGKSDHLAAAFGIAVSATKILTTGLLFIAMRDVWGWSLFASAAVAGVFFCIDAGFFLANLTNLAQGGYVPLLLAALVFHYSPPTRLSGHWPGRPCRRHPETPERCP
jgi:KUP system potassium uptake protein